MKQTVYTLLCGEFLLNVFSGGIYPGSIAIKNSSVFIFADNKAYNKNIVSQIKYIFRKSILSLSVSYTNLQYKIFDNFLNLKFWVNEIKNTVIFKIRRIPEFFFIFLCGYIKIIDIWKFKII